jgi:uncharacterized protein YbjT (DUF2867 family)
MPPYIESWDRGEKRVQKVLVAGATGYLGRFVVKELRSRGYYVRILARDPSKLDQTGHFLQPVLSDDFDELFHGEVTRPETLEGLCEEIDVVFSSIGITRQKDRLTFRDVDYQGNINILDNALQHHVKKFIYISVFNAHLYEHIAIIKAHEDFVKALKESGMDYVIVRPTGYFSDMSEFLRMAQQGRIYLVGTGENRLNPIHGADLAIVCADAFTGQEHDISVGGPVTYSVNEIAELAFLTMGKKLKITRIPAALARFAISVVRPFSKQTADLLDFFVTAGENSGVAPETGSHTLKNYYDELARKWAAEQKAATMK